MSDGVLTSDTAPDGFRASLRGLGPLGILAFLLIFASSALFMPLAALLVLLWTWATKTWRDLGLYRPKIGWLATVAIGLVLGVGLKIAMKALVMPMFGAPAANPVYHYLIGNTPAFWKYAAFVIIGAGFAEELFFRGFLFERSARLFGKGTVATAITLVVVTAFFGIAHHAQGPAGMINASIAGVIAALIFLYTGRNLWLPIVMHAAFDVTAGAIIYLNLETEVAHLVFK